MWMARFGICFGPIDVRLLCSLRELYELWVSDSCVDAVVSVGNVGGC